MIGLALDGGGFMHLNTDLQELADAAAIAGATQLDGAQDAITRATTTAQNFSNNNKPHWSNVAYSGTYQIAAPTFYYTNNATCDTATKDASLAQCIKVTTVARSFAPSLIAAVGFSSTVSTRATATAINTYDTCVPLQSFMCNPFEASESNPGNANTLPQT